MANLLSAAERADIDALLLQTEQCGVRRRRGTVIDDAVKALATGTEAFAALRMNQGIRQALSGRRLEEV